MKKLTMLLIGFLILSTLAILVLPSENLGLAYFDTGAPPSIVRIKDPTYCLPVILTRSSQLNISLEYSGQSIQVSTIKLYSVGREYEISNLTVIMPSSGTALVSADLPLDIELGLYTILVETVVDGVEYHVISPRSLWVVDEYPTSLKIMHLSDIHIGISMDD
ncbi:MAG: hypothetical protein ACK416_04145 [Zestosphaera sp.]